MSDDISKKITVEVEVTPGGQQQINQYKAAIDSLRSAISSLDKPIADFSKNVRAIDKDLAQMAASAENWATRVSALTKQMNGDQAKANKEANQSLKTNLTEADIMKQQAFVKDMSLRSTYYAQLAENENKQYARQKEKLDGLFKDKNSDQAIYQKEAQQLLQGHYNSLVKITDDYLKESTTELTAQSYDKINIDQMSAIGSKAIKQVTLPFPKVAPPKEDFFSTINGTFKSAFSSIAGYYKEKIKQAGEVTVQVAKKTADQVAAVDKSAADKKLSSSIDNAKKISDSIFSIVAAGANSERDYKILVLEKEKSDLANNGSKTAAEKAARTAAIAKEEADARKKAFKANQKASIAQATINGAVAITKAEAELGPIAGTIAIGAIVAQTAAQIITIAKQQPPALAKGGYFKSDGKGAVLPGYSRTDNTNAFLRSGEAVVVSEAMQVPWARNLVSAINVGFGGRDFSAPDTTRGYAVGGIFTDGGNANRYYSQPVNDQKNLANTIAYQMINNFPPVYVDVKDINNQQNILAQTINRVNL